MGDRTHTGGSGPWRVLRIVGLVAALLVAAELALQARAHYRYGQSVFNIVASETMYVRHEATGLRLLRPNRVFGGVSQVIESNEYGLRSPAIDLKRDPVERRITVLGASTVMGAYAKTNADTFPALLEKRFEESTGDAGVRVINAGMLGFTLREQHVLLEHVIAPLQPDVLIIYPGFNDFARYCMEGTAGKPSRRSRYRLPTISLPGWVLTVDLLLKNTVSIRDAPVILPAASEAKRVDADTLDLDPYRASLLELVQSAKSLVGERVVLSTNARAFSTAQDHETQMHLSETARHYNQCFDLANLHRVYDRHNELLADVVRATGVHLLDSARWVPADPRYFTDASHFSPAGERLMADLLYGFLRENRLIE